MVEIKEIIKMDPIIKSSGRYVYPYGKNKIIKIPKIYFDSKGEPNMYSEQSKVEAHVFQNCPDHLKYLLCPVEIHSYHNDYPIIIMNKMEVLSSKDHKSLLKEVKKKRPFLKNFYDKKGFKNYERIERDTLELCELFGLCSNDLINNYRNWGIKIGGIVYIDYGYEDREVKNKKKKRR